MADALSLLFELDADGRPAVAEFQRVKKAFASEIAALRKSVAQSFTLPPIKLPTTPTPSAGARGKQVDDHVKEFRRIEAEAAKSAKAQESEQARLNKAVEALQRQRSAAVIRLLKDEEKAAAASAKAQERAVATSLKAQERAASAAAKAQEQAARQAAARLARTPQSDQQVRDFRRIEAERQKAAKAAEAAAAKSARAQEREERRKNATIAALDRQRSAAFLAQRRIEERAAVASARAQERAAQQASRSIANAFRGLGPSLQSIGRTLTIGITAPLLALGAASLKSAKDLDANVNTLKAFTGSAEAAERRLAQLIKTSRGTPGLTTNLGLTLDAQLRTAQVMEETIDRVLPAIGRLNAVSRLPDAGRFTQNLVQLVTQNFERQDLKELVGQSPIAGQLIAEIFNVDSPTNAKAIRESAKKLGINSVDTFFAAFAEAAQRNQGLSTVTESIGTRFEKVVDRVTVALRPLGLAILNAIEPFVEPVAKLIERIGEAFNSLSEPVKTAIIVVGGLAIAAGPVLFVLGSLGTAIAGVVTALGTIGAAVAAIGLPAIAAVVAGIVVVIGEWVAILAALGLAWKTNFLNIRGLVTDAAGTVLEAFGRIKAVLEEVYLRILPTLQSITERVLRAITAFWNKFGDDIVKVVRGAFEVTVRTLEAALRFLGNFIDLVTKLIDGDFRGAFRAFSRILVNAAEGIVDFFRGAGRAFVLGINRLIDLITGAAVRIVEAAKGLAGRFVNSLSGEFVGSAPKVRDALLAMLLLAVATLNPGAIATALVQKTIAAIRRAAAEGVASVAAAEDQNFASVRLNPDGSLKTDRTRTRIGTVTGEGGKGADAETRSRIRLLELEAERAEAIARQAISAENIRFDQRKTSLKEFTDFQIREEEIVFEKKKAVFAAERAEAEKLKKGRELALGEIRLKELQAELEFADRRNQLLANQEREELEAAKTHRQALIDIQDEGDQRQLELIDSYVERYLISFEEAEKRRIKIEEDARDRRKSELEIQLGEAGQNVQEQQRITDAIAKLDAEAATAKEEAESRKRAALEATTEAENNYYQTLQEITLRTTQLLRDAAGIQLGSLVSRFGDRRKFRLEALRLEHEANEEEHNERLRQIEQEKQDAEKRLEGVRDAEEKLVALRRFYADLEKAENERRAAERRDEERREAEERDPFSSLRRRFEEFQFNVQNTNDAIADSLSSLSEQVSASMSAMTDAFRSAIVANILYGESIGKALKAALAQQLAAISAEAAIQSLKHAAYALGSLAFGDFAGAAKHAAAAAAFGALALAAGLAGRALSKSAGLFDRGRSSGTASNAVGGGEPQNRTFNLGGQGPVETSSQAARDGSGGFFGRVVQRIEALQQQTLDIQRQQMLLQGQTAQALTHIKGIRHGDALAMGAAENPAAVTRAVADHSIFDGEVIEKMQRNLGMT